MKKTSLSLQKYMSEKHTGGISIYGNMKIVGNLKFKMTDSYSRAFLLVIEEWVIAIIVFLYKKNMIEGEIIFLRFLLAGWTLIPEFPPSWEIHDSKSWGGVQLVVFVCFGKGWITPAFLGLTSSLPKVMFDWAYKISKKSPKILKAGDAKLLHHLLVLFFFQIGALLGLNGSKKILK